MHPQSGELLQLHALWSHDRTLVRRHDMAGVRLSTVQCLGQLLVTFRFIMKVHLEAKLKTEQGGPSSGVKLDLRWVLEKTLPPRRPSELLTQAPLTPFIPWHPLHLLNSGTLGTFCPNTPLAPFVSWHLWYSTLQHGTVTYCTVLWFPYFERVYGNLKMKNWNENDYCTLQYCTIDSISLWYLLANMGVLGSRPGDHSNGFYTCLVSQKKFGNPRSMHRTQC